MTASSAMVVFSGGQDSTTCLVWALERYERVHTIGFAYGQRHSVEMHCRQGVREAIGALRPSWEQRIADDQVINIDLFKELGQSALTHDVAIEMDRNGLPTTFVPGRNLIFLTAAAAAAYRKGIRHLVLGVCETDYSGYPDCRDDAIKAMQLALNCGMDTRFVIHTPLMWLDKAQTWELAATLGGEALVELILEQTHTCYNGERGIRHDWGYGCGKCPACELRARGYARFRGSAV